MPPAITTNHVAIIGAGIAGLAGARALASRGLRVSVLDKGRAAGGRASTRHECGLHFDHGAQYFTAQDPTFHKEVHAWLEAGIAAPWPARVAALENGALVRRTHGPVRYVGTPGMDSIAQHLAAQAAGHGATFTQSQRVTRLERYGTAWRLALENSHEPGAAQSRGPFHAVLITTPAPQAAAILRHAAPTLAARAQKIPLAPCWAAMIALDRTTHPGFDAAFVNGGPGVLSWIARDSTKPARPETETWVLHASPAWSRANLDLTPDTALERLLHAWTTLVNLDGARVTHARAHRWRHALPEASPANLDDIDHQARIAIAGDWCRGGRIEGAYLSGVDAANRLADALAQPRRGRTDA